MSTTQSDLKRIATHARSYGFIYPSSQLYEGLQGVYDYGPLGVLLKRNLQNFWWHGMVTLHREIVGMDAAILMEPRTWEASGHIDGFHDWFIDHKESKKRYRVDQLVEAHVEGKGAKEKQVLLDQLHQLMEEGDGVGIADLLHREGIISSPAEKAHWTAARKINLMFATELGAIEGDSQTVYLRPETAQGIFVNFNHVQKSMRMKLPFGIAQIGKAFRNELIARQFIFRMREFEQMEMQFFIHPNEEKKWYDYWKDHRQAWYQLLGIPSQSLSIHPHEQLAHYATAAVDITYQFPFGTKEIEGIHSRTDFDLRSHQAHAGKQLAYHDAEEERSYLPYVIETSAGCDRLVLMLLCNGLIEKGQKGKVRTLLKLPAPLAPYQAAILPLLKRAPFIEKARALFDQLRWRFSLSYDERGSIGKRYVRQDMIGTPYCITIDHETLEDDRVTIRDQETTVQVRIHIQEVADYLYERVSMEQLLKKLSDAS